MLTDNKILSVASRVLAWSVFKCCRPPWGLTFWGGRRSGVPQSEWRWGGAGGEKEQAAAEHPAPPEGGQREEPRLGEPPSSGACGSGLQEGKWRQERGSSTYRDDISIPFYTLIQTRLQVCCDWKRDKVIRVIKNVCRLNLIIRMFGCPVNVHYYIAMHKGGERATHNHKISS